MVSLDANGARTGQLSTVEQSGRDHPLPSLRVYSKVLPALTQQQQTSEKSRRGGGRSGPSHQEKAAAEFVMSKPAERASLLRMAKTNVGNPSPAPSVRTVPYKARFPSDETLRANTTSATCSPHPRLRRYATHTRVDKEGSPRRSALGRSVTKNSFFLICYPTPVTLLGP